MIETPSNQQRMICSVRMFMWRACRGILPIQVEQYPRLCFAPAVTWSWRHLLMVYWIVGVLGKPGNNHLSLFHQLKLKCFNANASFPSHATSYGVGLVARDSWGSCLWGSSKEFSARPRPAYGEVRAILYVVETAYVHRWPKIIVESDCLQVINILSEGSHWLASFGALLDSFVFLSNFLFLVLFFSLSNVRATHWLMQLLITPFIPGWRFLSSPEICHFIYTSQFGFWKKECKNPLNP